MRLMVAISFSVEKLIYRILSGIKITTIRPLNKKWQQVLDNFNSSKPIDLQFYYNQRSKMSLKFLDTPLRKIELYSLESMTENDAIFEGGDSKAELYDFFESIYGQHFLDKKYVRIWWQSNGIEAKKPNKTKIDWFDSREEKLYSINPLVINKSEFHNCFYNCVYCYAKSIQLRFKDKFIPGFYPERLRGLKYTHENVFISSMTDLFHEAIPRGLIHYTIEKINEYNENQCEIYFLTKNPARYQEFLKVLNKDTNWIGATIETNRYNHQIYNITTAAFPEIRINDFKNIEYDKKFVSIEPILRFDNSFLEDIVSIGPKFVFIGANSDIHIRNQIREPKREEVLKLIESLKNAGVEVILKDNLNRLIKKKIGKINYFF